MSTLEQRRLLRLRYRRRQLLHSGDLRRESHDETELQWWHNRALHDAHGVVQGLGVTLRGDAGSQVAVVGAGLAYDAYGRPLVVPTRLVIDLPESLVDAVLVLRVREPDDGGLGPPARPAGRPRQGVELCWARPDRARIRAGVPLACLSSIRLAAVPETVRALPGSLLHLPATGELIAIGRVTATDRDAAATLSDDSAYRDAIAGVYALSQGCRWPRRARRLARSRMVSGVTQPGETAWVPWTLETNWTRGRQVRADVPIGVQVRIDTTPAGFTQTPRYFAWLQGPLYEVLDDKTRSFGAHWDHVEDAGPRGFLFRSVIVAKLLLDGVNLDRDPDARPLSGSSSDLLRFLRDKGLAVSWLAVEDDGVGASPLHQRGTP